MAEVEMGNLYELNKQVMSQLPPQSDEMMNHHGTVIGDWFGKSHERGFMLMCKERSDFTFIHINDNKFANAVKELQEVLAERGQIVAIQYVHGEDYFEIGVKDNDEAFVFMLFEAEGMIVEV